MCPARATGWWCGWTTGASVGFDVKDYAHIDHGYAATVHKSQGVTVDRTHVLATSHMDRHAAYVGLSRHRERVDLHWSEDQVGSRERLTRVLGRERLKDTSLDYGFARTEAEPEIRREVGSQLGAGLCRAARAGAGERDRAARAPSGAAACRTGPAAAGHVRRAEAGGGPGRGRCRSRAAAPAVTERDRDGGPAGAVGGSLCAGLVGRRADAPGRAAGAAASDRGAGAGRPRARGAAPGLRAGPPGGADPCAAAGAGCRHGRTGWRR